MKPLILLIIIISMIVLGCSNINNPASNQDEPVTANRASQEQIQFNNNSCADLTNPKLTFDAELNNNSINNLKKQFATTSSSSEAGTGFIAITNPVSNTVNDPPLTISWNSSLEPQYTFRKYKVLINGELKTTITDVNKRSYKTYSPAIGANNIRLDLCYSINGQSTEYTLHDYQQAFVYVSSIIGVNPSSPGYRYYVNVANDIKPVSYNWILVDCSGRQKYQTNNETLILPDCSNGDYTIKLVASGNGYTTTRWKDIRIVN